MSSFFKKSIIFSMVIACFSQTALAAKEHSVSKRHSASVKGVTRLSKNEYSQAPKQVRINGKVYELTYYKNKEYATLTHKKTKPLPSHIARSKPDTDKTENTSYTNIAAPSFAVYDTNKQTYLLTKNVYTQRPIASITKLMTVSVVLDSKQDLDEILTVSQDDVDNVLHSSSKLPVGTAMTRRDMIKMALIASENRAASALGRHYPGGLSNFVNEMNKKATLLGMSNSHFVEPTGLNGSNVSTAKDLVKLVNYAKNKPLIRDYSSTPEEFVATENYRTIAFKNTNKLVREQKWDIKLSKTGFTKKADKCIVMVANIKGDDMIITLLGSPTSSSRMSDLTKIRHMVEQGVSNKTMTLAGIY